MDWTKLASRKFWITFAAAVVVLFLKQVGLDISDNQLWSFITLVTGYNFAQGYVDSKKVI